jgi:hypothetical protein
MQTRKNKSNRRLMRQKSKQRTKSKQTRRKYGSGPNSKNQNVNFGENETRVYDNTILPESESENMEMTETIRKCPDFKKITPDDFPCRYNRTVFDDKYDFNDWVKMNYMKNQGIDTKRHASQIREYLISRGEWKRPRTKRITPQYISTEEHESTAPSVESLPHKRQHTTPQAPFAPIKRDRKIPSIIPRFRENVNSRITEGLSNDEVV